MKPHTSPRWHSILPVILLVLLAACQTAGLEPALPTTPGPTTAATAPDATSAPDTPAPSTEPLIVLIDNDEGPITPANFNTFIGFYLVGWVYDPLFARSPDLAPVPALATSATPGEDGLTWEIQLRDDVTWHDGELFTADDVVFTYNFLREAGRAPNLAAVDTVTANGDYAVTITLSAPAPFFLNEGLAGYFILPEHIGKDQVPLSG